MATDKAESAAAPAKENPFGKTKQTAYLYAEDDRSSYAITKCPSKVPGEPGARVLFLRTPDGGLYACARDLGDCVDYSQGKAAVQMAISRESKSAQQDRVLVHPHLMWASMVKTGKSKKVESGSYGKRMLYADATAAAAIMRAPRKPTAHIRKWFETATVVFTSRTGQTDETVSLAPFAAGLQQAASTKYETKQALYLDAVQLACAGRGYESRFEVALAGEYRVDMVYERAGLAIECDELGHASRDKQEEQTRQQTVLKKYQGLYRFNPDAADVNEFAVAGDVLSILLFHSRQKKLPAPADGVAFLAGHLFLA
jgi:very-short-patch-repair endonuclease